MIWIIFIQPIFNCCLINIGDMLENGTVMNGKLIESPKSFQVACTVVVTQIISAVASSQYGGQSVDVRHLGKYLRKVPINIGIVIFLHLVKVWIRRFFERMVENG